MGVPVGPSGTSSAKTGYDNGQHDPAAHGMEPRAISTSCYHGHICHYAVLGQRLALRELQLGSASVGQLRVQ
ncbi:hypothetical protein [Crossiella sp. CA198]|uniref:hypothetical protein n=1 Tax=Crossiella sp. CA198 TaxID=3455607 RepID=UPI003F8D6F06